MKELKEIPEINVSDNGEDPESTSTLNSVDVVGGVSHQITGLLLVVERSGQAEVVVV